MDCMFVYFLKQLERFIFGKRFQMRPLINHCASYFLAVVLKVFNRCGLVLLVVDPNLEIMCETTFHVNSFAFLCS